MASETNTNNAETVTRGPRSRIVYSFLAVLGIVGLLPLGVVSYKLIDISRESLVTSQQEVQLQLASSMVRQLDSSVVAISSEMSRLAEGIAALSRTAGLTRSAQLTAARRQLHSALGSGLLLVRFSPRSGRSIEARQDDFPKLAEVEAEIAAGVEAASNGTLVSEPISVAGAPGQPALLAVTVPVGTDGKIGALTGVLDFSTLWDPLTGGQRAAYTLYALDSSGRMFASQDDEGILTGGRYKGFGVVQEFRSARGRSALTTEFSLADGGRKPLEYLASVDTTAQGWGIFVQLDKAQAYAAVDQMVRTTLIWSGLATVLVLGLAYGLAAGVTRPIKLLEAGTRAFAEGALDHRVKVRSRNEIGALAETFNSMARQLQEYIQRLKAAAQLNNELFMGTIKALAEAIDEKDPYTRGHSDRVNRYAVILGRQLGLNKKQMRDIHISSLFHDIGKIGIADKILQKPAGLTEEEFTVMKRHPEKGAQMLSPIKAMHDIIPGIRFHHERWDGSGYPLGLKGEQIPLAARIVAVADAFDAMTTNRPYQKAITYERAIARLRELSVRAYDRKVVDSLAESYSAGLLKEPRVAAVEEA